jgi:hypothetical protein
MRQDIRILKIIFVIADFVLLIFCVFFAADRGFRNYVMSPFGTAGFPPPDIGLSITDIGPEMTVAEWTSSAVLSAVPEWTTSATLPTVSVTETAGGSSSDDGAEESVLYDIPAIPDWTPRRYNFAYPALSAERFFNYGDEIFYAEDNRFQPDIYISFAQLDPKTVITGVKIDYMDSDYNSLIFEQYLLESDLPLALKETSDVVRQENGITCAKTVHPNPPMDDPGKAYFRCFARVNRRLILTSGETLETLSGFLSDVLDGGVSRESTKYFPTVSQVEDLRKAVEIRSCATWNEEHHYKSAIAGENDNMATVPLDIYTINAWLQCELGAERLEGLTISVLTVEQRWMMDQLVDTAYEMDMLDWGGFLEREDSLIVQYTTAGGIWVFRQFGNSIATLKMYYKEYTERNENPADMPSVIDGMKSLMAGFNFREIDITKIENVRGRGSGGLSGLTGLSR